MYQVYEYACKKCGKTIKIVKVPIHSPEDEEIEIYPHTKEDCDRFNVVANPN